MKNLPEKETNTFIYIVLAIIIAIVALVFFLRYHATPKTDLRALPLAQCLTQKGYKFYGANWCSHCAQQKALFGTAAPALTYVECFDPGANEQNKTCKDMKIQGYPTWITPTNQRIEGEQTIDQLIQLSSCAV